MQSTGLQRFPFIKRMDHHMQEVVRGASVAFLLKVVAAGLSFGLNVVLARTFGAEGIGLYILALSVTVVIATIGHAGLDQSVVRFVAASAVAANWARVRQVYRKVLLVGVAGSTLMAILMFVGSLKVAPFFFADARVCPLLRLMSLAVVPMTLAALYAQFLAGLKRVQDSVCLLSIWSPALMLAGIGVFGRDLDVQGLAGLYVASFLFTAAIGIIRWHRAMPTGDSSGVADFGWPELFDSAGPLFWSVCMQLILQSASTLILGAWGSAREVGIFGIAARIPMTMTLFIVAVNTIAAPKFAALHEQGDIESLGRIARHSAWLMALMASPLMLLFLVAPGWVMGLFGPQFTDGAAALSILAVGQFINVATGSVGWLLIV
jgi:O-antigen/teichoic acid export membrane protein